MSDLSMLSPKEELLFLLSADCRVKGLPKDTQTKLLNGWLKRHQKALIASVHAIDFNGLTRLSQEAMSWLIDLGDQNPNLDFPWQAWSDPDFLWDIENNVLRLSVLSNAVRSAPKTQVKSQLHSLWEMFENIDLSDVNESPSSAHKIAKAIDTAFEFSSKVFPKLNPQDSSLLELIDESVLQWYSEQHPNSPHLKPLEDLFFFSSCLKLAKSATPKNLKALEEKLSQWRGDFALGGKAAGLRDLLWGEAFSGSSPELLDVLNRVFEKATPLAQSSLKPNPEYIGVYLSKERSVSPEKAIDWCTRHYNEAERNKTLKFLLNKTMGAVSSFSLSHVKKCFTVLHKALKTMKKHQWDVSTVPLSFSVPYSEKMYVHGYHLGGVAATKTISFLKSESAKKTIEQSLAMLHPSFGGFFHVLSVKNNVSWDIPNKGVFDVKPVPKSDLRDWSSEDKKEFDLFTVQHTKFVLQQKTSSHVQNAHQAPKRKI